MSRARHTKKAGGGPVMDAGGNPNVIAEAKAKKKGGAVKSLGALGGAKPRNRLDRRGRKAGGRVGANLSPLSTAHKVAG